MLKQLKYWGVTKMYHGKGEKSELSKRTDRGKLHCVGLNGFYIVTALKHFQMAKLVLPWQL